MSSAKNITQINGAVNGKTVAILGGVHGNEFCGVKAIDYLRTHLRLDSGTVYLIYGNPLAIENGVRFTEMNLNRAFKEDRNLTDSEKNSYERKRALEIIPYLEQCDAVLDIHSSNSLTSTPFVICEQKSFFIAERMPFSIRSYGWDSIEPGGTDYFINKRGGYGICIECGSNNDPNAYDLALNAVDIFLLTLGLKKGKLPPINKKQKEVLAKSIYITKKNFKLAQQFSDFEKLSKNQLIGYDGDKEIFAESNDVIIVFARNRANPQEEAFILGRTK